MKGIIILGAAGLAKEFYFYIKRSNPEIEDYIFVNDSNDGQVFIDVDGKKFSVIKNWKFKKKYPFVVAVGNPKLKKILVERALNCGLYPSETIVDPSAIVLSDKKNLGLGGVISPGCVVTSNVNIGNFVTLNLNTTVGHDTIIGDFCTTNPGVHISGQIEIGDFNEFGTGCVVRDRLTIGSHKTFGAQTAVVKSIKGDNPDTYVGVPSKILIKNE
jgi:sugar O-acyltransferase (sialic acid O-acetyltransferase NeuD family)